MVKIRGTVYRYQDKLQLKLDKLRRADPATDKDEYEAGDFAPKTSFDIDRLWDKLTAAVASFTDRHLQALLESFLSDPLIVNSLREAPAAKAFHHAWIGGLLEHIVSLVELCDRVAPHYPEVNRDLLLTGAILHDIGKLRELSWGTSFAYSIEGQLLGHITIGIRMVEARIAGIPEFPSRLRTLVLHLILSHHGRLEYGSPKLPMTAEALLLHYLDDLEAKMQILRSEFAKAERPGEPTDYVRSMERALLDSRAYLANVSD